MGSLKGMHDIGSSEENLDKAKAIEDGIYEKRVGLGEIKPNEEKTLAP